MAINRFKQFTTTENAPTSKTPNRFKTIPKPLIKDDSTLGVIKNTVLGLPKAAVEVATHPSMLLEPYKIALPGVFERAQSVKESIQQKSLEPLKQSFAQQAERTFPNTKNLVTTDESGKKVFNEEELRKGLDLAVGFMSASGNVSKNLAKNAEREFLAQGKKRASELTQEARGAAAETGDIVKDTKALLAKIEKEHPERSMQNAANSARYELDKVVESGNNLVARAQARSMYDYFSKLDKPVTEPALPAPKTPEPPMPTGPGFTKFSRQLDTMVGSNTLHQEDADILKEVFKDTNDDWLREIDVLANPRLQRAGNARWTRYGPGVREATVKKGFAKLGLDKPDTYYGDPDLEPSMVVLHEYGHLAHRFVLNMEERDIVRNVFNSLSKKERKGIFQKGMTGDKEHGLAYFAKNEKEFLVQSFAEYVMENKVPAEKMRPLLQKLADRFFAAVVRLVNRGKVQALERLRPIFEKMLSGDKSAAINYFMEKQPTSTREEIKALLAEKGPKPEIPKVVEPPVAPPVKPKTLQEQILEARAAEAEAAKIKATVEPPVEFPAEAMEVRKMAEEIGLDEKLPTYDDLGNVKKQFRDITRNTEQVFGKDFPAVDKTILEPFNQAKGSYIDMLNSELDSLSANVVDKFGFKRGSKESEAIQLFGEKKMTMQELVDHFGEEKASQIAEAEKFFREVYDKHIDALNVVEQQIYPSSPQKWTPKRLNYFRHYHELASDFSRLQNILENPIRIDPMLVGISEGTSPKSKWASFKQQRGGDKTVVDAIGGYLDYLPSVSYAINIDPHIGKFRELADVIARGTEKSKNLNNYIYNVRMFANQLSGKTAEWDRLVQESIPGGRTTLQAIDWLNQRVKANTILFNVSSSIAQVYNIPQGLATAGPTNSIKGLSKTLGSIFAENKDMAKSTFIKERYFKGFSKFDHGILNNTKKAGIWMVTVLDEMGTKFIWNGQLEKAKQLGVPDPIKYADDMTKKLVAGRGIGEKPLAQNSKVFQIIAPFQLELTNLWWVMEDMAKSDKKIMNKFGQFATLFAALYLFNSVTEEATGNRLALDPVQMTLDGYDILKNQPNLTGVTRAGGRIFGEALSNMPLGQTFAAMYPEFGTTVSGIKTPTRKQFFGREDPTRFGGGLMVVKGLTDPLYKIFPPFGGGQIKKTISGLGAVGEGKSTNVSGDWQYHIDQTPANYIKGTLFGKSGTQEAQDYYNKKLLPKGSSGSKTPNRFKSF